QYANDPNMLGFKLCEHEKERTAQCIFDRCLETYIGPKLDQPKFSIKSLHKGARSLSPAQLNQIMADLDEYSLRQFLTHIARFEERKLSQGAIDMICAVLAHEMQMSCSMAFIISQYMEFHAKNFTQIEGGMDKLPKAFVTKAHALDESPENSL